MKKTVLILAGALALTACGNSGASQEEARIADSIAEQQRQDSIAQAEKATQENAAKQDSISEAMYANPLSIKQGKAKYRETNPPSESFNISLPIAITNFTDIELQPEDYQITYCNRVEYSDGSGHEDTPKSIRGPKLAPGETANITITAKYVNDIAKVKAKMQLPLEEFKTRRNPAQVSAGSQSASAGKEFKGSWELEEPEEEFTYRYDVVLDLYAKSVDGASGKCYGCISYIFGFSSQSVENSFINEVKRIDGNTATVSMGSYDGNFEAIITYNPANKSITIKTPSKKDSGFDGKTFKKV